MRTLASVLEAAIQRSAAEVTLESEQPVIYRTARGSEAEQVVLARPELYDMLAMSVSDELQVELMLGNAIEFEFEVKQIKWQVRAVPGADVMLVRIERGAGLGLSLPSSGELDVRLDDVDDFGISLETPPDLGADDPDFDLDGPIPPPRAAVRRSGGGASRSPAAEAYAPTLSDEPIPSRTSRPAKDPAPAAFESGTWALDDDEGDFDLDPPAESAARGRESESARPGREFAQTIRLPASEPVSSAEPSYSMVEASSLTRVEARRPSAAFASRRTVNDVPAVNTEFIGVPADDDDEPVERARSRPQSQPSDAATHRELEAHPSPDAETHRELDAVVRGPDLAELVADVAGGTLVYLLQVGLAEHLAAGLQVPILVLDEEIDQPTAWARARTLSRGSILVIKHEDPSPLLGWILRRLEQGYRVVLDCRASSPEGARRILLGTTASARAEAWLAEHPQIVVESSERGPQLRKVSAS